MSLLAHKLFLRLCHRLLITYRARRVPRCGGDVRGVMAGVDGVAFPPFGGRRRTSGAGSTACSLPQTPTKFLRRFSRGTVSIKRHTTPSTGPASRAPRPPTRPRTVARIEGSASNSQNPPPTPRGSRVASGCSASGTPNGAEVNTSGGASFRRPPGASRCRPKGFLSRRNRGAPFRPARSPEEGDGPGPRAPKGRRSVPTEARARSPMAGRPPSSSSAEEDLGRPRPGRTTLPGASALLPSRSSRPTRRRLRDGRLRDGAPRFLGEVVARPSLSTQPRGIVISPLPWGRATPPR